MPARVEILQETNAAGKFLFISDVFCRRCAVLVADYNIETAATIVPAALMAGSYILIGGPIWDQLFENGKCKIVGNTKTFL